MPRQKKQHLKRRKDGRFCCVYHGVQFMGNTEDEALQKRNEYKWQEKQETLALENPSVRQYADRWLPVAKAGLRPATYRSNKIHIDHLCAVIGDMPVKDVKPMDIKKVYSSQYLGKSKNYTTHAKAVYSAMFASAVEDGLLRTNPVRSESAKPHKAKDGSHRAITQEERWLIENVATEHRMHTPAIVMLYAGLRPQEIKALRVEDVDFDTGVIHVRSFIRSDGGNHYELTDEGKTAKATRDVPLFTPVRKALEGKTGLLISDDNGNVASRATWQCAWESYKHEIERYMNGTSRQWYGKSIKTKALADKDELPPWKSFDVVPYDLRHSFVTWCRDCHVELHTCVEWMGHANASMILKIYDEVSYSRSQSEAEKLEKTMFHVQNNMQDEQKTPENGSGQ